MKTYLPMEELDPSFAPFIDGYLKCLEKAFSDYRKMIDFKGSNEFEVFTSFNNYIKCGIIQNFFWSHAKEYFKEVDFVKVGTWNTIEGAVLNGKWFIRFNKISKYGKIGGIKTPQKDDFLKQKTIKGLPEGVTYILSGYKPSETWTEIENVYFACWNDTQLKWLYEVSGRFEEQTDITFSEETHISKKEFIPKRRNDNNTKTGTEN